LIATCHSGYSYAVYCPQQIVCSTDDQLSSCVPIGMNVQYWNSKLSSQSRIYSGTYIFQSAATKCLHSGKTKCTYDIYDTAECIYSSLDQNRPSTISLYNNINYPPEVKYGGSNWQKVWSSNANGKGIHDICKNDDPLLCALGTKNGFLVYFYPYPETSRIRVDIGSNRGVLPGDSSYFLLDNFRTVGEVSSQGLISVIIVVQNPIANKRDLFLEVGKINVDLNHNTSSINKDQLRPEYRIEKDPVFSNTYRIIIK